MLKIKPLHHDFVAPYYASRGAAGMDFFAIQPGSYINGIIKIPLGFAMELEPGKAMLLTTRSSWGVNYGAGVPQGYGLIDADYRGEVCLILHALRPIQWNAGDRIAQGIIIDVHREPIAIVDELSSTDRNVGGFGSTGK